MRSLSIQLHTRRDDAISLQTEARGGVAQHVLKTNAAEALGVRCTDISLQKGQSTGLSW